MLLTGASLSGCIMNFRGSGYNYNGADKYRVFDGAVQDDFTKLDIGWISGDVTVGQTLQLTIGERGQSSIPSCRIRLSARIITVSSS